MKKVRRSAALKPLARRPVQPEKLPNSSGKSVLAAFLALLLIVDSAQAGLWSSFSASSPLPIPKSLGFVSEVYPNPQSRTTNPDFILIQNLHVNRSVQMAISGILKHLKKQGLLPQRVAVEGLVGPYDVSAMQHYPNPRIRKKVCDYLVSQGEMPGSMHFLVTEGEGGLYGVETEDLYKPGLALYRLSYEARRHWGTELEKLKRAIFELKRDPSIAANASVLEQDIQVIRRFINTQLTAPEVSLAVKQAIVAVDHLEAISRTPSPSMGEGGDGGESSREAPPTPSLPHKGGGYFSDTRLKAVLSVEPRAWSLEPIAAMVNFYALALLRDGALFQHALELRELDHQGTTVLVMGGFHTAGLTTRLKAKGLSYMVITPHVRRHDHVDERLYVERMLGHHLTPEQVAAGKDWAAQNLFEPEVGPTESLFVAGIGDAFDVTPAIRKPARRAVRRTGSRSLRMNALDPPLTTAGDDGLREDLGLKPSFLHRKFFPDFRIARWWTLGIMGGLLSFAVGSLFGNTLTGESDSLVLDPSLANQATWFSNFLDNEWIQLLFGVSFVLSFFASDYLHGAVTRMTNSQMEDYISYSKWKNAVTILFMMIPLSTGIILVVPSLVEGPAGPLSPFIELSFLFVGTSIFGYLLGRALAGLIWKLTKPREGGDNQQGKSRRMNASPFTRTWPALFSIPVSLLLYVARIKQEIGHAVGLLFEGARPIIHWRTLHPSVRAADGSKATEHPLALTTGLLTNWIFAAVFGAAIPWSFSIPFLPFILLYLSVSNLIEAILSSFSYSVTVQGETYDSDMKALLQSLRQKLKNPSLFTLPRKLSADIFTVWDKRRDVFKPQVAENVRHVRERWLLGGAA